MIEIDVEIANYPAPLFQRRMIDDVAFRLGTMQHRHGNERAFRCTVFLKINLENRHRRIILESPSQVHTVSKFILWVHSFRKYSNINHPQKSILLAQLFDTI